MPRPLLVLAGAGLLALPGLGRGEDAAGAPDCIACRVPLGQARGAYSPEAWRRLEAGEVLTAADRLAEVDRGARRALTGTALVPAPPERVWAVLTDWESYPGFMPNVAETKLRRVEGSRAWIAQHLRVFFTSIRYGSVWTMEPELGVARFALDPTLPHDIAANEGSWRLSPVERGEATLLEYSAHVDTGRPVPRLVEELLVRRSLPRVLRGVRHEVQRREKHPG